jgi:hypothetical protein
MTEATLDDKIKFYDGQATRLHGRIKAEIEALIEDMQHTLEKMERPDYTPPIDGIIRNTVSRIDGDCAKLATMREMLGTLKA